MDEVLDFFRWLFGPAPGAGPRVAVGAAAPWQVETQQGALVYTGCYALYDPTGRAILQVAGRIVERAGFPVEVFLRDPPARLTHHPKWHCFQLLAPDSPWFKLHWERPTAAADAGRAYVEQMLAEALLG